MGALGSGIGFGGSGPQTPQALSGGDSPGTTPLSIGNVTFNSIECPDKLPIGAVEQKMVVVDLIGGGRVVQTLGPEPMEVMWEGRLWGTATIDGDEGAETATSNNNVSNRVQQLRSYVVSGQSYPLVWANEQWQCVVKEFTPTYMAGGVYCDYKISLEIIDSNNGALSPTNFPTVDSQVNALNSQGQQLVDSIVAKAEATNFGPVSIAWQDYLIALGILFELEQIFN